MRYRIWDKVNNEYFKPIYNANEGRLQEIFIGTSGDLYRRNLYRFEHESVFPDQYILERSTELYDNNAREVYEGDLIGHKLNKVDLVNGCWCINGDRLLSEMLIDNVVIGTIHDEELK